jgi:hypothetical protein
MTQVYNDSPHLLPDIRELFGKLPEARYLQAWELQQLLWSLGYTEDLAPEAAIEAALEALRVEGELLA